MAFYQLKSLFTGESAGGDFTLTSVTSYPTTFFVFGVGNVTISSIGDLPYTFPGGYNVSTEFANAKGGIYTISYCVPGCTTPCSVTTLTMIEKPVLGTTPTVMRCGVNGVYGNTSACFAGGITNYSDGTPYTEPLSYFSWSKDSWFQNSQCVTIPGSVTAGTINLQVATVAGPCGNTSTVQLVDVNIFAGAPNAKSYCWDKVTYDAVKNLPGAVGFNEDLTVLFNPVGQLVPSGTSDTWSFVSGPKVISMLTNKLAKFQDDVLEGTYVFKRTLQYGTCISEANFTIIIKFCSRGVLNIPLEKSCLLNTNVVMNTTYASSYPAAYNVLSTSGCWLFMGNIFGGDSALDIEINGIPYTNYDIGCSFPYNATVKITSVGKYDFSYANGYNCIGGCAPCGCVYTNDAVTCGCPDGIITSSGFEGLFRINTMGVAPTVGSSQILAMGCGTRKASLFTTFNQLNGGGITAGGVWTYQGLADPITILVNGVSTTLNIGSVLVGSDPEIDLAGLPNPSNYSFKYTVTTTCGTANRNLIVNITCNDCTKVVNTTVVKSDCSYDLTIIHPDTFANNQGKWTTSANTITVRANVIRRLSGTCGLVDAVGYTDVRLLFSQRASAMTNGDRLESIKLMSSVDGAMTISLDPSLYLSGIGGAVNPAHLVMGGGSIAAMVYAIRTQIKNAIGTVFGVTNSNYFITVGIIQTGLLYEITISMYPKNLPSTEWVCFPANNGALQYKQSGISTTNTTILGQIDGQEEVGWTATSPCQKSLLATYSGASYPYPLNMAASTPFNYVLVTSVITYIPVTLPQTLLTSTCKQFDFATTISPACSGTPTYSYKVGGVAIPQTTATFNKKPYPDNECNPFNSMVNQQMETTVGCDGCTYVKTPITFC